MFVLSAIIAQKYIVYGQGPIACKMLTLDGFGRPPETISVKP